VRCRGTAADLIYDPDDEVEVRVDDARVAWADADGRGADQDVCEPVRTQDGWFVGFEHERTTGPTTLRCRFPDRFFVHAHPTFSSESGELFPDGSALYLVAAERRSIVASASVADDSARSSLQYVKDYCTPR
jgi:hypothetical protein